MLLYPSHSTFMKRSLAIFLLIILSLSMSIFFLESSNSLCLLHRFTLHISFLTLRAHTYLSVCALSCSVMSNSLQPMDCSLPGSSVHGILQARILEWVAIHFSRGSSWLKDLTWVSCIAGGSFTIWATREALESIYFPQIFALKDLGW